MKVKCLLGAMATVLLLCLSFTGCKSAGTALQKKADRAGANAQYDLGLAHANDKDVPQDYKQAVTVDPPTVWKADYDAALKQAAAENKYVLVSISGLQWCGWCKALESEVFSKPEFIDYAKDNLICVLLDFNQSGRATNAEFAKQHEMLLERFQVQGFPTVIILNPQGKGIARDGYQRGGPVKYVEFIKGVIAANPAK